MGISFGGTSGESNAASPLAQPLQMLPQQYAQTPYAQQYAQQGNINDPTVFAALEALNAPAFVSQPTQRYGSGIMEQPSGGGKGGAGQGNAPMIQDWRTMRDQIAARTPVAPESATSSGETSSALQSLVDYLTGTQQFQEQTTGQLTQMQTLLDQYQQLGMTQQEATQRALADMRTDLSGQINTQGQQFNTLLDQYQQMGMTQQEANQRALADMRTDLSGQLAGVQNNVNSTASQLEAQGQQISMLATQYEQMGFTQQEALDRAMQDMQPAPTPSAPPSSPESSGSSQAAQTGMTTNSQGQTVSNDATIAAQDAANFGPSTSSESNSGGKIVCTAMNQEYGFGSFRQSIWLRYSAQHMTKAHEVGYHAMFLPLVDYGFKQGDALPNRMVRKLLEHVARHRTADLRAEMRGSKRDYAGRAYRLFLEPLCLVVGKLKGY